MRVSCDVAPYWTPVLRDRILRSDSMIETRGALRNSLVRSFMDKRFWINDPDCLMLRTRDTKLTAAERRTLYNAIMLVGGMLVTSDDMALYGPEELLNLARAIEIFKRTHEGHVTALDLVQEKIPEIIWNDKGYVLLANFDDSARSVHIDNGIASLLPVKGRGLRDVHSGEEYLFEAGGAVGLEAHDSLLCELMR